METTLKLQEMNKLQLVELRKEVIKTFNAKYRKKSHDKALYGNLQRSMRKEFLMELMESMSYEHKMIFMFQFLNGLRISEIQHVEIAYDMLIVKNCKMKRKEYLPITEINKKYLSGIEYARRYSPDYLRQIFRNYLRKKKNYIYEYSSDKRPLYQYNNHSLRHTAISLVGDYLKDPYKIGCYSRHDTRRIVGIQAVYRHYSLEQMRKDLEEIFIEYKNV